MQSFNPDILHQLYLPPSDSHKGQNGKVLIVGGSTLFHAASLWALTVASRIVDMVFYASVQENNTIVHELKREFRNGIIVSRNDLDSYAEEAESILIGPGLMRTEVRSGRGEVRNLEEINALEDEGEQSYYLTKYLLKKFPQKKWIIDAGALQMMELDWLKETSGHVLLTPHLGELERIASTVIPAGAGIQLHERDSGLRQNDDNYEFIANLVKEYNCMVLLKGEKDLLCSPKECIKIAGGNPGMTKGGTGDVLAGLIAGLAAKNDLFVSAACGAYINKKAGESLAERVGPFFNATDLANEIPVMMKKLLV